MNASHRERWIRLWESTGLSGDPSFRYDQLVALYSGPNRFYHNLQHLTECLQEFDEARFLARRPITVELAIWFHDAIYDSHADDNEERSAQLAREWLSEAGGSPKLIESVTELILATQHNAVPEDPDTQLIVDVDLSILGRTPARFHEYELQIRQEYSWVPEEIFATRRAAILRAFLARERIFATDWFRAKYEKQARRNLHASALSSEA